MGMQENEFTIDTLAVAKVRIKVFPFIYKSSL